MTDVTKIKAAQYAKKNDLSTLITLPESGNFIIPADLHERLVLEPAGITVEQNNRREELEKELAAGVLYTTGTLAHEYMAANPESVELGFSYPQGKQTTVSGFFNRDDKQHVVLHVETKYKTADMQRVLDYLGGHFDNINV